MVGRRVFFINEQILFKFFLLFINGIQQKNRWWDIGSFWKMAVFANPIQILFTFYQRHSIEKPMVGQRVFLENDCVRKSYKFFLLFIKGIQQKKRWWDGGSSSQERKKLSPHTIFDFLTFCKKIKKLFNFADFLEKKPQPVLNFSSFFFNIHVQK